MLVTTSVYGQYGIPEPLTNLNLMIYSFQAEDIDNDGLKDIIVGGDDYNPNGTTPAHIAWYRNEGQDNFQYRKPLFDSEYCSSLSVSDIDLDGDKDIICSNLTKVKIAHNFNNGEFTALETIAEFSSNIVELITFDADNDGDSDIVLFTQNTLAQNLVYIIKNQGLGSFDSPLLIAGVFTPKKIRSVDIDNDNDLDLIFNESNKITKITNDGNGNYISSSNLLTDTYEIFDYEVFDINNNGFLDIITTGGGGVKKYLNQITSFSFNGLISTNNGYFEMSAGDIDQDGDIDIACNKANNELIWLENASSFIEHSVSLIAPKYILLKDINGDLKPDLLATPYGTDNFSYYQNTRGSFSLPYALSNQNFSQVVHGDINNDGNDDLISVVGNNLSVLYSNSNGEFSAPFTIYNSGYLHYIALHDMDLDGDKDIIGSNVSFNTTKVFNNNGDSSFSVIADISITGDEAIHFLDYDNDGDQDFFSGDYSNVRLARNMGGNFFSTLNFTSPAFNQLFDFMRDDVNNDGYLELFVVGNYGVSYYLANSNGTMTNSYNPTTPTLDLNSAEFVDMDGDGDKDALTWSNSTHNIGWYRNDLNTTGLFNTYILIVNQNTSTTVGYLKSFDIDSDGNVDIFFDAGLTSETFQYYHNLGGGLFELNVNSLYNVGGVHKIDFFDSDSDFDNDLFVFTGRCVAQLKNLTENPYQSKGSVFYDHNHDGVKNGLDYGLNLVKINSTPTEQFALTRNDGSFRFNFDSNLLGSYTLVPEIDTLNWSYSIGGNGYLVDVNTPVLNSDSLDYGIFPIANIDSLNIDLTGGFPRCNSIVNYFATIRNVGTTNSLVKLDLNLSTDLNFVSASLTPDSISGTHCYWHFDSIDCFSNKYLSVQVEFPDFTSMGNTINSTLSASVIDGSTVTFNSIDTLSQVIVCAYDPNDKVGFPIGEGNEGIISQSQDYLDYLVRFQNTGNDTALNITIRDFIDTNLVYPEIEVLASSHNLSVEINQTNEIKFVFNNINLPDSSTDYSGSNGFVKYRIPLKDSLFFGTPIKNTAYIYFDYNPPISTNTTLHTIERPATFSFISDTVCGSYLSPSGNFNLTTSGIIQDTINNWYQGDSIITIDVVIILSPVISIINETQLSVQGGDLNTNWQWIYCDSIIINGETNNIFNVSENGSYSVIMSNNVCIDTSSCILFDNLEILSNNEEFYVFPNPFHDYLKISSKLIFNHFVIYSNDGQLIDEKFISPTNEFQYNFKGNDGMYFIRIDFENSESKVLKLIHFSK